MSQAAPPAEPYAVILVYSVSHALKAEKVLQEAAIPCKLIPVPRHLSSDCGVCLRIARSASDTVRALLEAHRIEIQEICDWDRYKQKDSGESRDPL